MNSLWGIECEVLSPNQVKEKCSIIETSDIFGGFWIPKDGVANPTMVCNALIDEARKMGVNIVEHCAVTEVMSSNGKVSSVNTSQGTINCDYFVNCAGFWARHVGQMAEPCVKVPLHAAEHHTVQTKPIDGLDPMTPIVRDLDGQIFLRECNGCIMGGGFELEAKAAFQGGVLPSEFTSKQL